MLESDWPKPPTKQPITFQPQRCCMCVRKKSVWAREREREWVRQGRGHGMAFKWQPCDITGSGGSVGGVPNRKCHRWERRLQSQSCRLLLCIFFVNEELNLGSRCDVTARSPLWMVVSPWQQALRLMVNGVRCTLHTLLSKTRLVFALMMFWLNTNVEVKLK